MKDNFKNIIYDWVAKNFGESEADDPSWSIEALADELADKYYELKKADKTKLYQAEMEAMDFADGYHTLKEWAEAGINAVHYNGNIYYDGLKDGYYVIPEEENVMLELDYWDLDEDGYHIAYLKKVKE